MNNARTTDQSRQGASSNIHNDVTTKPSLRSAINAKCLESIYCPLTGTGSWRLQVKNCTSISCPLYSVGPKSNRYITKTEDALENSKLGNAAPAYDVAEVEA